MMQSTNVFASECSRKFQSRQNINQGKTNRFCELVISIILSDFMSLQSNANKLISDCENNFKSLEITSNHQNFPS